MSKQFLPAAALTVWILFTPGISAADSQKPSTVNGVSGTAISATTIRLNWNKPWDDQGVVGYNIYRNDQYYATSKDTNFTDDRVQANSSYSYSITAFDEARNYSIRSSGKSVSTVGVSSSGSSSSGSSQSQQNQGSFGTPSNFRATSASGSGVTLQWDGAGKGFNVYRDGSYIATANSATYKDSNVASGRTYQYYVTAFDGNGNRSGKSSLLSVSTSGSSSSNSVAPPSPQDDSGLSTPSNLRASKATSSGVELQWNGSGYGYNIYRDGRYYATVHSRIYTDTGVSANSSYRYYATAFDRNGQYSNKSQELSVNTDGSSSGGSDSSGAISSVTNLSGASKNGNQVHLSWNRPSSGNTKGYNIYRNNGFYKSVSTNSYDDWGVSANSTYQYKIVAYDHSSNRAPASATISVTVNGGSSSAQIDDAGSISTATVTSGSNSGGPISKPRNLRSETLNSNQVKLYWDHPESGSATSYNLYQDNNYIKTVYANTYTISWIESGRDYRYYLTAIDKNKNYSAKSISIFANTSDATANTTINTRDSSSVPNGYNLIFSEEFNNSNLDSNKWSSRYKWGPDWLINYEKQYYVDILNIPDFGYNPLVLDGEYLTIKADKTPDWLKGSSKNQPYLSGMLNTYSKFTMKYGYVEMRAKVPKGKGLWSAFWLLHQVNDKNRPEIDVTEILGHKTDITHQTYHYYSGNTLKSTPSQQVYGQDYSQDFHTYGMKWEPGKITWYVDGSETHSYSNSNVSSEEMYLIVNLAVGGWWPGDPDGSTEFPARLKIDYIRAYQQ